MKNLMRLVEASVRRIEAQERRQETETDETNLKNLEKKEKSYLMLIHRQNLTIIELERFISIVAAYLHVQYKFVLISFFEF